MEGKAAAQPLVVVVREDPQDGGFVAQVVGRPGVMSQGETVAEALANVGEAFEGVGSLYLRGPYEVTHARLTRAAGRLLDDIGEMTPKMALERAAAMLEGPEPDVLAAFDLILGVIGRTG